MLKKTFSFNTGLSTAEWQHHQSPYSNDVIHSQGHSPTLKQTLCMALQI